MRGYSPAQEGGGGWLGGYSPAQEGGGGWLGGYSPAEQEGVDKLALKQVEGHSLD